MRGRWAVSLQRRTPAVQQSGTSAIQCPAWREGGREGGREGREITEMSYIHIHLELWTHVQSVSADMLTE